MGSRSAVLVGALVVVIALGACSTDDSGGSGSAPAAQDQAGNDFAAGETAGDGFTTAEVDSEGVLSAPARSGTQIGSSLPQAPAVGPSVIKTAEIQIEVGHGDLQSALNQSIERSTRNGGFVVTSTIEESRQKSGSLVVRVPAEDFEDMLASLERLGNIEREVVAGRDVSEEFIDLGARIRNFQAQEAVVLRLMRNADSIDETIRIQNELQTIRLEIERLKGRLRFLRGQAEMASISVRFQEAGAAAKEAPKLGLLAEAWGRAIAAAVAIASAAIVGLGIFVPLVALGGLVYLVGRSLIRAFRPRFGPTG